jgi:ketosteroid isomerase-like protein
MDMKIATAGPIAAVSLLLFAAFLTDSCGNKSSTDVSAGIVALEKASLDRWGKGDPQGYIENFAPEITYFDPFTEHRVDGMDAMKAYLAPIAGKVKVARFEMIGPKVQRYGEVAVLSFQLISYGTKPDGTEMVLARWNSTEVYRQTDAGWKIAHNHWSYIKPELKQPVSE